MNASAYKGVTPNPILSTSRRFQVYEPGGLLNDIRDRVKEFMGRHNEEFPAKKVTNCMYVV